MNSLDSVRANLRHLRQWLVGAVQLAGGLALSLTATAALGMGSIASGLVGLVIGAGLGAYGWRSLQQARAVGARRRAARSAGRELRQLRRDDWRVVAWGGGGEDAELTWFAASPEGLAFVVRAEPHAAGPLALHSIQSLASWLDRFGTPCAPVLVCAAKPARESFEAGILVTSIGRLRAALLEATRAYQASLSERFTEPLTPEPVVCNGLPPPDFGRAKRGWVGLRKSTNAGRSGREER